MLSSLVLFFSLMICCELVHDELSQVIYDAYIQGYLRILQFCKDSTGFVVYASNY